MSTNNDNHHTKGQIPIPSLRTRITKIKANPETKRQYRLANTITILGTLLLLFSVWNYTQNTNIHLGTTIILFALLIAIGISVSLSNTNNVYSKALHQETKNEQSQLLDALNSTLDRPQETSSTGPKAKRNVK